VTKDREQREVKPPPGPPDPPDWLEDEARAAWDYLVPLLNATGILSRIDRPSLSRYCLLWARWREMEEFIKSKGVMYPLKDEAGKVKCFQQWPQVAIANKLAAQLTRMEAEFGLTPSSRARIQVPAKPVPCGDKARFFTAR
jgi:P27 family predicted phage terminase small subunit